MSTGTWDYDGPDPNKPEQWNTSDGLGLAGPVPSAFGGPNGEPVPPDPNEPDTGSGSGNGPYGQATRNDHKPLDAFGTSANAGADATDASADVNVTGANNVAGNSSAEAKEIASVPDPQSPAGQAAILAIIEKYQAKSAGTVESSANTEQAHGSHAADSSSDSGSDRHHGDSGSGDGMGSGGGGGLMGILSSLLGGGSGMGGMNPLGQQGMSPFGQGMGGSPFGDPYAAQRAGAATPAADPFATPAGAPATQAASYTKAADPFASTPSSGTASATNAGSTSADPFAAASTNDSDKGKTDDGKPTDKDGSGSGAAASSGSSGSGVDTSAFGGTDGTAVPADPAATTS